MAQEVLEAGVGGQATESVLFGGDEALQLFKPVEHDVDLSRCVPWLPFLYHQEPLAVGRDVVVCTTHDRVAEVLQFSETELDHDRT